MGRDGSKFEDTIEAQWCWDSETGKQVLIAIKTGEVLAVREVNS